MESNPLSDILQRSDGKADIIHEYLETIEYAPYPDDLDGITAGYIANQLYHPRRPLRQTVIIIPVAAASEQSTIGHALDEYGRQTPLQPFSVVLGLNYSSEEQTAGTDTLPIPVEKTIENLRQARRRHPDLDIRTSYTEYSSARIGAIRRDLWNGVLMTYRSDGISQTDEMVGINHDIDLVHLPRLYTAVIQRRSLDPRLAQTPTFTQLRHAWDPNHPRTSRAVFWRDFVLSTEKNGYEAGAVIPMTFYAARGGFEAVRKTAEVHSLIGERAPNPILHTGYLSTSPRRYVERLPSHGFDKIWTNDSFGPDDTCREPDYVAHLPDLSQSDLIDFLYGAVKDDPITIFNNLEPIISREIAAKQILSGNISRKTATGLVTEYVSRRFAQKLRIASRVLQLCLPDGFTPTPPSFQIENYGYAVQAVTNHIVKDRHSDAIN